ncbi:phage terminase large subunit family protein [Xanthomonas campestris pv. trichodesmae]|uniref:Terminase n=2 Tax=Xanthomonas citri TaxID=346 RepID=A0AB33CBF6_XANCI|nr:phage terminase large subunit family protein [Xanthomonas citri]ASK90518.1 terminase [Xanthomonas citri pv. vignicola]MBV6781636.1 phage terminase large subunit family protein [Xanthomonas campestris pv. trichodesmae]MBZ3920888.1 terminase [Xanthomonas campestris pv. trichodesmae]MBZ3925099.1 terminase [Xanthomonas citri pv. sesbaniae]
MNTSASLRINAVLARALQPRRPLTVSQWCDEHMRLSSKGSSKPGHWVTDRNPPLREPMDAMSARSPVHQLVAMFPIQFGKSQLATNAIAYWMDYAPAPIMYALPGEASMNKWIAQKLNPMIEVCPAVRRALSSTASRDSANQRTFKDFAGGQLYVEHMGSPQRLKSTTVKYLGVDEIDEAPQQLITGDDPVKMLDGRTSAFPTTYKRLYISTPGIAGLSRIAKLYEKSDQRRFHVPCPHCGHYQALSWSGLVWSPDAKHAWYACSDCGTAIEEHHKTDMIAAGRWVAANPDSDVRGYTINCLYYQFGLGPRWADLAREWLDAQNDPASLKTFINDRLAETWEDPSMRAVKHNVIADRAEPYRLRHAPRGVLAITVGVDTQDNRLAVHIVGWGRGMAAWTLDYVELLGDPAEEGVWVALTDLLNRPIEREDGTQLRPLATAIDAGGHRTEAVKHYVRQRLITRPMCIFGAVPNNAPILSKGKLADVTWRGRTDKRGINIYHVGGVAAKHYLYSRLSADAERQADARLVHFSDQLPPEFFPGLVSEVYNPVKNRFEKRVVRNEPLDTWVYAYAAAHHPEVRLHRYTKSDWEIYEVSCPREIANPERNDSRGTRSDSQELALSSDSRGTPQAVRQRNVGFGRDGWSL